jgi:hypothetical protein
MTEIWKTVYINNYKTCYEISNLGRGRNTNRLHWKTKGILKPKFNKQNGYYSYCLTVGGKEYYKYIHRLVGEYFIKFNNHKPQINHIDGDKSNNRVTNLEWCTQEENMRHCFYNNLSSVAKTIYQYDLYGKLITEYSSTAEAERKTGINAKAISQCGTGETKHAGEYQWSFTKNDSNIKDISKTFGRQSCGVYQLDLEGNVINYFPVITQAYTYLGKTDNGAISQACKGKQKTAYGFKWKYENDY